MTQEIPLERLEAVCVGGQWIEVDPGTASVSTITISTPSGSRRNDVLSGQAAGGPHLCFTTGADGQRMSVRVSMIAAWRYPDLPE